MIDYKRKYKELRSKMIESVDVAYRLGYEEGMKEGQMQAQQQQMEQQMAQQQMEQQMAQQQMGQEQAGQEVPPEAMLEQSGQEVPPEAMLEQSGQEAPPEELADQQNSSDLDDHIQELESLVQKGEKPSVLSMRDAVNKLAELRKNQKESFKKKQSQIQSSQKKLVDGILKKWEKDVNEGEDELERIIKESEEKLGKK